MISALYHGTQNISELTKDGWPRWNSPANAEVSLRKLIPHGYQFEEGNDGILRFFDPKEASGNGRGVLCL